MPIAGSRSQCGTACAAAAALLVLLVLLPQAGGVAAAPARSEACRAIGDCIDTGALCVLVQLPPREKSTIAASEAYADMEVQVENLLARRPDVRFSVVTQDLSRLLRGLKWSSGVRTVFLSGAGLALVNPGLYVDDPALVEAFFATQLVPESLHGQLQPLTLGRRPGACPNKRP